jgi:cephalosporin hydroxylase
LALLHEARLREAPWLEANRQMSVSATTKRWVFWCFIVLVLAGGAYVFRGRIVYLFTPAISTLSNIAYYENSAQTWKNTSWLGVSLEKYPTDLFVYQEIIYETKPDVLIEAGTLKGGSAYFFASLFDLLGKGRVITMDIVDQPEKPKHPRIEYLLMSSISDEAIRRIKSEIKTGDRVMVSLDSNHAADHVFKELQLYSPMVTIGCYLVVEDTNINGHPVYPAFGPGPMEAVKRFLAGNQDFEVDRSKERFMLTVSPSGYLRRVR